MCVITRKAGVLSSPSSLQPWTIPASDENPQFWAPRPLSPRLASPSPAGAPALRQSARQRSGSSRERTETRETRQCGGRRTWSCARASAPTHMACDAALGLARYGEVARRGSGQDARSGIIGKREGLLARGRGRGKSGGGRVGVGGSIRYRVGQSGPATSKHHGLSAKPLSGEGAPPTPATFLQSTR